MNMTWNLDIDRITAAADDTPRNKVLHMGYRIKLLFALRNLDTDVSSLSWNLPRILFVDDDMKDCLNPLDLKDYTVVFYHGFRFCDSYREIRGPAMQDAAGSVFNICKGSGSVRTAISSYSIHGFTLDSVDVIADSTNNRKLSSDQDLYIATNGNIFDHDSSSDTLSVAFAVYPKDMSKISTAEKEEQFVHEIGEFIYSNVVVHYLDMFASHNITVSQEPTFTERVYTRNEILSKIDDPLGHVPKITLSKKDREMPKSNLDYTRRVRVKPKSKISEEDHGEEEGSTAAAD